MVVGVVVGVVVAVVVAVVVGVVVSVLVAVVVGVVAPVAGSDKLHSKESILSCRTFLMILTLCLIVW